MDKTYASCDFGMDFIRKGRVDIIARGIERCMESLGIPLKVVGTLLPELHKFDIRFENEDQKYWASSISADLDYFIGNKQDKDKLEILTGGARAGDGKLSTIDSGIDVLARGMEKCLRQFYSFGKKEGKIDITLFENLKNITVTARKYFDIKHTSSHKCRVMIEFNTEVKES